MASTAKKTDPKLWEKVKAEITRGDKGGEKGQWSARKAQMAVQEYKRRGGKYVGGKKADNHLVEWEKEDWGTKSGHESRETGERYLPKKARESLSSSEYKRTSDKKRADRRRGKQFSRQPADVAKKTARSRTTGKTAGRKKTTRATPAHKPAKRKTSSHKTSTRKSHQRKAAR